MAANRVARLTIEVIAGDGTTGQALAERASAAGPMLGEVIARRLDALDDGRRYRLDRLDLRLTPCRAAAFETDLAERLDEALAAALPNHLSRAGATDPVMDALDVVTTFASSGRLPWWTPSGPATLIDAVTTLTTDGDAEAAAHVQFILLRAEPVRRLVRHLPVTTLAAIVTWLTGIAADDLRGLFAAAGAWPSSENDVWQTLLAVAAASAAPVATPALAQDVHWRLSQGDAALISVRHSEMPRTEPAAVTAQFAAKPPARANDASAYMTDGATARIGDAKAGNDAIHHSHVRQLVEEARYSPVGSDSIGAQPEIEATLPRNLAAGDDDAHRSDDAAYRSRNMLPASDTPPAYATLKPDRSSAPEVPDGRYPINTLATKHGAGGSAGDGPQANGAGRTHHAPDGVMSSPPEIEPRQYPPSSFRPSGQTALQAYAGLSEIVENADRFSPSRPIASPLLNDANQSVPSAAPDDDRETPMPSQDEAYVSLMDLPDDLMRTEPRRSTSARLPAVEHDTVHVETPGLPLLWPYIGPFLSAIGLIDAGERFVSTTAQHRAALLLDHLATGERDAPEYRLPLAKLLAGLPLDAVHEPGPPLDDDEAAAAHEMLRATLADLASFGHLSIAGLRDAWLRRPGLLTVETGQFVIRVEGRPWDMLLDRLPWPIAQVRLPWMPDAIRIEW